MSYPKNDYPLFPYLSVWKWVKVDQHMAIFPSIECPENPGMYDVAVLGTDYDGSVIGMIVSIGPEMGKTFYLEPAKNDKGEPRSCTRH